MNREVEFLFDYGNPFSYLANVQIEGFAKRNGAAVTYTPILLGAVLKATGNGVGPISGRAAIQAGAGLGRAMFAVLYGAGACAAHSKFRGGGLKLSPRQLRHRFPPSPPCQL